jgi:hypothetical protein
MSDRENILSALREKPLKVYEIMRRANVMNEESCQSLLLKMRDEGSVKFDIHKGRCHRIAVGLLGRAPARFNPQHRISEGAEHLGMASRRNVGRTQRPPDCNAKQNGGATEDVSAGVVLTEIKTRVGGRAR